MIKYYLKWITQIQFTFFKGIDPDSLRTSLSRGLALALYKTVKWGLRDLSNLLLAKVR